MPALPCAVLTDLAELTDVEPHWVELIQRVGLPSVFQHPGWVRAWWRSYGSGRRLLIMVCHEAQALVGIVPLMLDPRTRQIQFIGHPLNDRNGIVASDARRKEVWKAVLGTLSRLRGWDRVEMPELLDHDVRECAETAGRAASRTAPLPSPLIDLPARWADHVGGLSRKRSAGWRRDMHALRRLGDTRFVCRSGAYLADRDVAAFHQDRIARWRYAGRLHELSEVERG